MHIAEVHKIKITSFFKKKSLKLEDTIFFSCKDSGFLKLSIFIINIIEIIKVKILNDIIPENLNILINFGAITGPIIEGIAIFSI